MADFETSSLLSVTLDQRSLERVRDEIEEGIGETTVTVAGATASPDGGTSGSGTFDELGRLAETRNDLLESIHDTLQKGALSDDGGGGGMFGGVGGLGMGRLLGLAGAGGGTLGALATGAGGAVAGGVGRAFGALGRGAGKVGGGGFSLVGGALSSAWKSLVDAFNVKASDLVPELGGERPPQRAAISAASDLVPDDWGLPDASTLVPEDWGLPPASAVVPSDWSLPSIDLSEQSWPDIPPLSNVVSWPSLPSLSEQSWPEVPSLQQETAWPEVPDVQQQVSWPSLPSLSNLQWPDLPTSLPSGFSWPSLPSLEDSVEWPTFPEPSWLSDLEDAADTLANAADNIPGSGGGGGGGGGGFDPTDPSTWTGGGGGPWFDTSGINLGASGTTQRATQSAGMGTATSENRAKRNRRETNAGATIEVTQEVYINPSDLNELERKLDDKARDLRKDLQRQLTGDI